MDVTRVRIAMGESQFPDYDSAHIIGTCYLGGVYVLGGFFMGDATRGNWVARHSYEMSTSHVNNITLMGLLTSPPPYRVRI